MPTLLTARINRNVNQRNDPHVCIHRFHVLGMLVSGNGYCTSGNVRSPPQAPWITLMPEGRRDGNHLQGPYESRYICFRWKELKITADRNDRFRVDLLGFRQPVLPFVALDAESAAFCAGLFEEVRNDLCEQEVGRRIKATEGFLRLLRTYLRLASEKDDTPEHRELLRFRDLLTQRAFEPVSVEALSAPCRLTSDHLGRLFKQAYGTTPLAFRTALRMDRASDLLDSSNLNVSEIARQVGYEDPLYFSRAFRRHFGVPPSRRIRTPLWPPRAAGNTSSRRTRAAR